METLAILVVSIVPFFAFGTTVEGRFLSITYVTAAAFVLAGFASRHVTPFGSVFRVSRKLLVAWAGFTVACLAGLLASRFALAELAERAAAQLLGLATFVLAAAYLAALGAGSDRAVVRLARALVVVLGLIGLVGLVEFLVNNINRDYTIDFSVFTPLTHVWDASQELILRATSVASEPAHLVRFLAMGFGLALVRFGVAGRELMNAIKPIVPIWAAISIAVALALTLSVLAIVMSTVCFVCLLYLRRRIQLTAIVFMLTVALAFAAGVLILGAQSFDDFLQKVDSLSLLLSASDNIAAVETQQVSALAILSNREVVQASLELDPLLGGGIGSHSLSYYHLMPNDLARLLDSTALTGLNAEDASGLLLRLLSETGLIGTLLFCLQFAVVVGPAARLSRQSGEATTDRAILMGLLSGYVALLFIALTRYGAYFDPALWIQTGLVLGITAKMSRARGAATMRRDIEDFGENRLVSPA